MRHKAAEHLNINPNILNEWLKSDIYWCHLKKCMNFPNQRILYQRCKTPLHVHVTGFQPDVPFGKWTSGITDMLDE